MTGTMKIARVPTETENLKEMHPSLGEYAAMLKLIQKARNASAGGGKVGIAAGLMQNCDLLADSANHLHLDPDITRHAEFVTLRHAAAQLDTADLSQLTLLSTLQPCAMCLAAARFSGTTRIIFAARKENVSEKYFAFPHLTVNDSGSATVEAIGGVLETEVIDLYRDGQE